ncbi:MAG: asparaginase [Campylobacteraceae bacterium]|nr:asparaginase [Campylobacteraceae bacterium]
MSNIVAKVYRGDYLDLTHRAHVAVVDSKGKLLNYIGDPNRLTFVRSCAKPMQALVACEIGAIKAFGLNEAELALLCASHNGEDVHTGSAKSILAKAGLDESILQCGFHPSLDSKIAKTQPKILSEVYSNCSGKHLGMILSALHLNENIQNYWEISHPHQQRIIKTIADLCDLDFKDIYTAVDGCGVPVHALSLKSFALGVARMANPEQLSKERAEQVEKIVKSMIKNPFMVSGSNRLCTALMEETQGKVFAKVGADGCYSVGVLKEGIGIMCKIEDGNIPIVEGLIVHLLYALRIIDKKAFDALEAFHSPPRKNHRDEIGGRVEYFINFNS